MVDGMTKESETLSFEPIKEHRGKYIAEYLPPSSATPFALLHLIFIQKSELIEVAAQMEHELQVWLARYPIPIKACAFDDKDDPISLKGNKNEKHFFGWKSEEGKAITSWQSHAFDEHLKKNPISKNLRADPRR